VDEKIERIVNDIRRDRAVLAVDGLTFETPFGSFQCQALLELRTQEFSLEVKMLSDALPAPVQAWINNLKEGVESITKEHFWNARGELPDVGPFTATDIIPPFTHNTRMGYYWTASLKFDRLVLCDHPMTEEEKEKAQAWWNDVRTRFSVQSKDEGIKAPAERAITICARISALKSPFFDQEAKITKTIPGLGWSESSKLDTFVTESSLGTIVLHQDDDDLEVHLHYKESDQGEGDAAAVEKRFEAILNAVGLSHAVNALPYYYEHETNGSLKNRWLRPMFTRDRGSLTPFWKAMQHSDLKCKTFLSVAAEFFSKPDKKLDAIKRLLWLFHDTDSVQIPLPTKLLSVCSLIEGLVTVLLDQRVNAAEEFGAVKKEAITWASSNEGTSEERHQRFWGRLTGYLKSWGFVRPEEKWRALCENLGLPWEAQLKPVHDTWKKMRNPLAHGGQGEANASSAGDELTALSQIGGAFLVLIAAHIGYRGSIQISPYENKVISINPPPTSA
jgi:hypothetical protein